MEHLLPKVQQFDSTTRAPKRLEAPPASNKNTCPYCHAPGYKAPGFCKNCGVSGYPGEEPPLFKRSKWKRRPKSDPLLMDELASMETEDIQEYMLVNPLATEAD